MSVSGLKRCSTNSPAGRAVTSSDGTGRANSPVCPVTAIAENTPIVNRRDEAAIRVMFELFPFLNVLDFSRARLRPRVSYLKNWNSVVLEFPLICGLAHRPLVVTAIIVGNRVSLHHRKPRRGQRAVQL